jgi:Xaa-Pro aminopeptidase
MPKLSAIPDPFKKRIGRLLVDLEKGGFSGLIVFNPENRRYLSGFRPTDPQINESSGFLIVAPQLALLGTDPRFEAEARKQAKGFYGFIYRGGLEASWAEIKDLLAGLDGLAFESQAVSFHTYQRLKKLLRSHGPAPALLPSRLLVENLRRRKDRQELKAMRRSLEITEEVFQEISKTLRVGQTEKALAWAIKEKIHRAGGEGPAFDPIVASGPNAALPHAEPTDRSIKMGEPILFDFGSRWQGYCSDLSRTLWLGRPNERFKEIYGLVRKAQEKAEQGIRAGLDTVQVDNLARSVIEKGGYGPYFKHSLGHGVGLSTHELPSLSPVQSTVLEADMVVTIEPGIYLPGWGGVRLENMVLIREKKSKVLNRDETFYRF